MTNDDNTYDRKEAESRFEISGEFTAEESGQVIRRAVQDAVEDEVSVSYGWDDGVVMERLSPQEAKNYVHAVNEIGLAQPLEKEDDSHYWSTEIDNSEGSSVTSLPNPEKVQKDGDINGSVRYNDGLISFQLEFDAEYDIENEAAQEGTITVEYADRFDSEAEDELTMSQEGLDHLEDVAKALD